MDDSKVEGYLGSLGSLESFRPLEKVLCLRIDDEFGDGDSEEVSPKVYFLFKSLSFQKVRTHKDKASLPFLQS